MNKKLQRKLYKQPRKIERLAIERLVKPYVKKEIDEIFSFFCEDAFQNSMYECFIGLKELVDDSTEGVDCEFWEHDDAASGHANS